MAGIILVVASRPKQEEQPKDITPPTVENTPPVYEKKARKITWQTAYSYEKVVLPEYEVTKPLVNASLVNNLLTYFEIDPNNPIVNDPKYKLWRTGTQTLTYGTSPYYINYLNNLPQLPTNVEPLPTLTQRVADFIQANFASIEKTLKEKTAENQEMNLFNPASGEFVTVPVISITYVQMLDEKEVVEQESPKIIEVSIDYGGTIRAVVVLGGFEEVARTEVAHAPYTQQELEQFAPAYANELITAQTTEEQSERATRDAVYTVQAVTTQYIYNQKLNKIQPIQLLKTRDDKGETRLLYLILNNPVE